MTIRENGSRLKHIELYTKSLFFFQKINCLILFFIKEIPLHYRDSKLKKSLKVLSDDVQNHLKTVDYKSILSKNLINSDSIIPKENTPVKIWCDFENNLKDFILQIDYKKLPTS